MKSLLGALAIALAIALPPASAEAAALLSLPGSTAELAIPDTISFTFTTAGGDGLVALTLIGERTVDGSGNCCTDIFSVALNGVDLFQATFNLGGGGGNVIFLQPAGATVTPPAAPPSFGAGGSVMLALPLTMQAGLNTLSFTYSGTPQGLTDEAWRVSGLSVTGPAAVPEPGAWALMVAGFAGTAAMFRRRRMA